MPYALITYQTAFLKTYYKEDFIAATMSTELIYIKIKRVCGRVKKIESRNY